MNYRTIKKFFHMLTIVLLIVLLISPSPNIVSSANDGLSHNVTEKESVEVTEDDDNENSEQPIESDELATESDEQESATENDEEVVKESDEVGADLELEKDDLTNDSNVQVNSNQEDVNSKSILEKTIDGVKELAEKTLTLFQPTESEIQFVLATDDDFSVDQDGNFIYIGRDEYVEIPHTIKGIPVTSYKYMFRDLHPGAQNRVKAVKSTNKNVTDMSYMFFLSKTTELDLRYLDTENVTDMSNMFYACEATKLDLSDFDTRNVTNMSNMFFDTKATELDLSSFDTTNVTNMYSMFRGSKATKLNISSFNTENVTDMSNMFDGSHAESLDLSNFNTSNVKNMIFMFYKSKAKSLNLSSFDTKNVENMRYMFAEMDIPSLDLSSFNTSKVTSMTYMFWKSAITDLDLSSFDTTNVLFMGSMFDHSDIPVLDLSSFDTSHNPNMSDMFLESTATKGYTKTQADANRFNYSRGKPSNLRFVVKGTPVFSYSENGNTTYKHSHSVTVNVDGSGADIVSAQYAWSNSASEQPLENEWIDFNDGDTLTFSGVSGDYYLHVRAKSTLNIESIEASNVFKFDNTNPTIQFSINPESYTKDNVFIIVTGEDAHSGVKRVRPKDGIWTDGESIIYEVSENGTYEFEVEDEVGLTHSDSITIETIDKIPPEISLTQNGGDWAKSHATKIVATDDYSGLAEVKYTWSTDDVFPTNEFATYSMGEEITTPDETGEQHLHVRAIDFAGNVRELTSSPFKVDVTGPTQPTISAPESWQNTDVTVEITDGLDEHSGVNYTEYRIDQGSWNTYENDFTISNEGETIVEARTVDKLDNISEISSKTVKIDKTLPEITLTENGGDWAKSHATKIVVTDNKSGVGEIEYVWSTSEDFPTSGFTTYTDGEEITTPNETGFYYLHVRATDRAGNEKEFTSESFKVDLTAPTAPTVIAPVGWQNGEVTVKVIDGTDESSGVNRSEYRIDNGLWQTYENEFIITEAGETIVEARTIDHAGNISAITSETIMIDKTSPEITFDKDGGDWAKSHATKIVVTDEYSGVEQIGYAWSTSEDFPTNGFTTYTDGTIITTPSETGTYYLHVRSNDYAGNVSELTSKAFKVDVTAPNVPTITAPIGWQNSDVTVEITDGIDEHSGVLRTEYRINDGSWIAYVDAFEVSLEGEITIEAKTIDQVGNESTTTSVKMFIDKVKPTITITPSPTELTHDDVVLEVNATDDRSGVKLITLPDSTVVTSDTAIYTVKQNGTYTFVVEDNAGNKHTELIEITNIDKSSTIEIPGIINFGNVKLTDEPQFITADIPPVIVKDWRDAPNEWRLSVSASPLKLENENFYLPVGTIQLNALDHVIRIKGSGDMPVKRLTTKTTIDDGDVTVVQSTNSRGEYHLEFPNQVLEITIDATTAKAGKYESTMTWELVTAP